MQKREEAQVSYAITKPSIKVVEYAKTNDMPISPKPVLLYLFSFVIGIMIVVILLYFIFLLNTRIYSREDLINAGITSPILAEIPVIREGTTIFNNPFERSILAESFRMLCSNLKYHIDSDICNVIMVSSTIKGEGKTFVALNTSLGLASIDKKVLLIGADLRNPQLHKYIDMDKNNPGLVDFLVDDKLNWKTLINKYFDKLPYLDVMISGSLPPNPVQLLANGNLEILLKQARKEYDFILIDTAPTLLVTDTITIADNADAFLYISRANLTNKEVLEFPIDLVKTEKLKNVGIVLNGIGDTDKYGYNYGYQYGYGYKYSYNYGYGYGYGHNEDES